MTGNGALGVLPSAPHTVQRLRPAVRRRRPTNENAKIPALSSASAVGVGTWVGGVRSQSMPMQPGISYEVAPPWNLNPNWLRSMVPPSTKPSTRLNWKMSSCPDFNPPEPPPEQFAPLVAQNSTSWKPGKLLVSN